ncbi:MAG: 3-phosphoglycerate dehydrogenase [Alphaproteobacteria bacterium]|nr:3-phosphoglycerate dehydrogenase [Alphaproteobacteria bacterium]
MSTEAPPVKVLYFNHGGQDLYDLVKSSAKPGIEIVTLETGSVEERLAKIADADAVIVGSFALERPFIDAARRLRLVHHQGVGYHDTVDTAALRERQIALAIAPGGTSIGVAEHTIMLMLAVGKRLAFVDAEMRRGKWHTNDLRAESHQLTGATVGIVGLGRIGKELARMLTVFRTTTLYHDILEMPADLERELKVKRASFDELLGKSDVVTLHVPLTKQTHHMIDTAALKKMKRGAYLINNARGPVVSEAALIEALKSGHLGGAGMDTYEVEPPPGVTPLAQFRNVVLTPHHAPGTIEAMKLKMDDIFANIDRFRRGEALVDRIELG